MSNIDCASHLEIGVGTHECLHRPAVSWSGSLEGITAFSDSDAIVTTACGMQGGLLSPSAESQNTGFTLVPISSLSKHSVARSQGQGERKGVEGVCCVLAWPIKLSSLDPKCPQPKLFKRETVLLEIH